MNRQKMITIPADDLVCVKVGSLAEYQRKRRMAGYSALDRKYQAEVGREAHRPRTLREVLGIDEGLSMRLAFPFAVRV